MSIGRLSGLLVISGIFVGCMEQYNPRPHWKKIENERRLAHRDLPSLNDDGTLPVAKEDNSKDEVQASPADEAYKTYCVSCHGDDGKANTAAGKAMNPRPRDFTDLAWHNSVDDDHIEKVIRKGGAAVGLSPMMAPWEALLPGDLPQQLVEKIRSFKSK